MNLQVNAMTVAASGSALEGDRSYLELIVTMSRAQTERAIFQLLRSMPEPQAFLKAEFPEWFNKEEITT